MMAPKKKAGPTKAPYPFTRSFEAMVCLAEASLPRFHDQLGHAVDPERMPSPDAQLLVASAQAIAAELGAGCPSQVVLCQHVRSRVDDGSVTFEQLQEVEALLELAEDLGGIPDLEAVLATAAPVVRRFATQETLEHTIQTYGSDGDGAAEVAAERFAKAATIGRVRGSIGQEMSGEVEDIKTAGTEVMRDPLATGVTDLDIILCGGLQRGKIGLVLGGTGDGKSLSLSHFAAEGMLQCVDVVYLSLEESEENIKKSIYANLVDMEVSRLAKEPEKASARYRMLIGDGLGRLVVHYEAAESVNTAWIRAWLKQLEKDKDFSPGLIVVDYLELLSFKVGGETGKKLHQALNSAATELRNLNVERDGWLWTASQTVRSADGKKKVQVGDAAESMGPVRRADVVLGLARTDEDREADLVRMSLPKRRGARAHGEVGPLPMDAERGRLTAVSRSYPWDPPPRVERADLKVVAGGVE